MRTCHRHTIYRSSLQHISAYRMRTIKSHNTSRKTHAALFKFGLDAKDSKIHCTKTAIKDALHKFLLEFLLEKSLILFHKVP